MTITNDEFRALAEKATPGPWRTVENRDKTVNVMGAPDDEGCYSKVCLVNGRDKHTAAYIAAASPDRVIALLNENEALRASVKALEGTLRKVHDIPLSTNAAPGKVIAKMQDTARAALEGK